jgi:hypothetical protein
MNTQEYTSALPEFLSWQEWAVTTLTDAELAIYHEETDPMSAEKIALYERWVIDQKLTSHIETDTKGAVVAKTVWTPV